MRVLFVGSNQTVITRSLAGMIKVAKPDLFIASAGLTVAGTRAVSKKHKPEIDLLLGELDPAVRFKKPTSSNRFASLKHRLIYGKRNPFTIRWIYNSLRSYLSNQEFDLIHVHALSPTPTPIMKLLTKLQSHPIVVSCWGSDVLRSSDMDFAKKQQSLLRRSDMITVSSPEICEIVLSKYGRDLLNKIATTYHSPSIHSVTDRNQTKDQQEFRAKHQIASERKIVCVSHNGHAGGQHLALINSLKELDVVEQQMIHLLFPMTYGANKERIEMVRNEVSNTKFEFTILTEYLSDDEVAQLRSSCDVFIYAPVSDAFSASVSQALAAKSICILGSWLPYKLRVQAGLKYWEVDSPSGVAGELSSILRNWTDARQQIENNRSLSIEMFERKKLGQQWIDVYEKAIVGFTQRKQA